MIECPKCGSADTRRSTAYWQCLGCGHDWQTPEHTWKVTHAAECPVTAARRSLLGALKGPLGAMERRGLQGALPEYDLGGDQEVELCTCGAATPAPIMGATASRWAWFRGEERVSVLYPDVRDANEAYAEGAELREVPA